MQPSCTGVGCFKPSCRHCATSHDDSPSSAKPDILVTSRVVAHVIRASGARRRRHEKNLPVYWICLLRGPTFSSSLSPFPASTASLSCFPGSHWLAETHYNSRDALRDALTSPAPLLIIVELPIGLLRRHSEKVNYISQRAREGVLLPADVSFRKRSG